MTRRPLKPFLRSSNAIQAHLLCLTLIGVLAVSIWEGNAQPDYKWGLLYYYRLSRAAGAVVVE